MLIKRRLHIRANASQAAQCAWQEYAAKLNTARRSAAAAVCEDKHFLCGGYNTGSGTLSCVEAFDPANGTWQLEGNMKKARHDFPLFAFDEELYAVAGDGYRDNSTIEKKNKDMKQWELVADFSGNRFECASCLVGTKIFLFGGGLSEDHQSSFDLFDLVSKRWASKTKGRYKAAFARRMPRKVRFAKAVFTSLSSEAKNWTHLDVTKLEERGKEHEFDQFEAITGNVIFKETW